MWQRFWTVTDEMQELSSSKIDMSHTNLDDLKISGTDSLNLYYQILLDSVQCSSVFYFEIHLLTVSLDFALRAPKLDI